MDTKRPTKSQLMTRRAQLIDYLKMKIDEEDWHGVQDAGSDLREIDAKLTVMEKE